MIVVLDGTKDANHDPCARRNSNLISFWTDQHHCIDNNVNHNPYKLRDSSLLSFQTLVRNRLVRSGQFFVVFLGCWPIESHDLVTLTRYLTQGTCPSYLLASS